MSLVGLMVCPDCRGGLGARDDGWVCDGCGSRWERHRGFPKLYREVDVRWLDRFMRLFYDGLPALHDPLTRHLLPRLQGGGTEHELRQGYLKRMDLPSLRLDAAAGQPRILEVGVGAGANLALVEAALPAGAQVAYWGLDLSAGMLRHCRRAARKTSLDVRLLLGDVHALPFANGVFDRVFHVGAMGSFGNPQLALAEMARVARPGTPVVVVDEQLDRRANRLRDRLAFRLLTFYDADPGSPSDLLPDGATVLHDEQISRFYYCLTFSMSSPTRSTMAP